MQTLSETFKIMPHKDFDSKLSRFFVLHGGGSDFVGKGRNPAQIPLRPDK